MPLLQVGGGLQLELSTVGVMAAEVVWASWPESGLGGRRVAADGYEWAEDGMGP